MDHNKIIDVDMVVSESEINVINAMFDYYNKAYMFIESYHGDVEDCCNILQEQLIMESATKNETKNKKSILKQLLDLVKKLCRKAIDNIKKHIIDPLRSVFKKSKYSDKADSTPSKIQQTQQIEEPVKIDDIITFTNKLLNIDIFRKDINVNELESDLYTILEENGGMTPVEKLCDKMEKVTSIIKQLETKISDINKRVDDVDNITDEEAKYVEQLWDFCNLLKKLLNEYLELTKEVDSKIKESMSSNNNNVIDDKYRRGPYCVRYKKR